jgi:Subtilisin-like serine proteases
MVHVAIIDDGINEKLFDVGPLKYNIEITSDLKILQREGYDFYNTSHGTTCSAIIKKYFNDVIFSSIKILNNGKGSLKQILKAIEWCIDKKIQIVNMSLGTVYFKDFKDLKEIINYANKKGLLFVAACNNNDVIAFPAAFSNVVGVKRDIGRILSEGEYVYNMYPIDGIEVTARGNHFLTDYTGRKGESSNSNSYAAPFITAKVCEIIEKNPDIRIEEIKRRLYEGGVNYTEQVYNPYLSIKVDWVMEAVVFVLGSNSKQTSDIPFTFNVKKIEEVPNKNENNILTYIESFIIRNQTTFENVDTIVLIIEDKSVEYSEEAIMNLLRRLVKPERNVIFISDECKINSKISIINNGGARIWHPNIYKLFYNKLNSEVNIDVPLISIYDFTGREVIKLVSNLVDHFREDGYFSLGITDKCIGVLLGLEYMQFYSTSKTPNVPDFTVIKTMFRINKPDILILGIDANSKDSNFFREAENNLEMDIKILIIDKFTDKVNDIIKYNKDSKQVICLDPIGTSETEYYGIDVFKYFEENCLLDIYKYLINLLD